MNIPKLLDPNVIQQLILLRENADLDPESYMNMMYEVLTDDIELTISNCIDDKSQGPSNNMIGLQATIDFFREPSRQEFEKCKDLLAIKDEVRRRLDEKSKGNLSGNGDSGGARIRSIRNN